MCKRSECKDKANKKIKRDFISKTAPKKILEGTRKTTILKTTTTIERSEKSRKKLVIHPKFLFIVTA